MFVGDGTFERKKTGDKRKTVEFRGMIGGPGGVGGVKFEEEVVQEAVIERSHEESGQDSVKIGLGFDFEV